MGEARRRKKLDPNFGRSVNFTVLGEDEDHVWDLLIYSEYEKIDESVSSADLFVVDFGDLGSYDALLVLEPSDETIGVEVMMKKPIFLKKDNNNAKNYLDILINCKKRLIEFFFIKHSQINDSQIFPEFNFSTLPQVSIFEDYICF